MSNRGSLLIGGNLTLQCLGGRTDMLGGFAVYAALTAAPFGFTQLWTRSGEDLPQHAEKLLKDRRIDLGGCLAEGLCTRDSDPQSKGPSLPSVAPSEAGDVKVVLLGGLDEHEWASALADLEAMGGREERFQVLAANSLEQGRAIAADADVLLINLETDQNAVPLSELPRVAEELIKLGPNAIFLYAGSLGGLLQYKQKGTTYPARPQITKDNTGSFAAFSAAIAGHLLEHGKLDFRGIKRGAAVASAIAGMVSMDYGPKRVLTASRSDYNQAFTTLRRNQKF